MVKKGGNILGETKNTITSIVDSAKREVQSIEGMVNRALSEKPKYHLSGGKAEDAPEVTQEGDEIAEGDPDMETVEAKEGVKDASADKAEDVFKDDVKEDDTRTGDKKDDVVGAVNTLVNAAMNGSDAVENFEVGQGGVQGFDAAGGVAAGASMLGGSQKAGMHHPMSAPIAAAILTVLSKKRKGKSMKKKKKILRKRTKKQGPKRKRGKTQKGGKRGGSHCGSHGKKKGGKKVGGTYKKIKSKK